MDRYRCPACGVSGYRGRRCGTCLYEPFGEEIAHGAHYHAGEPLVMTTRPKSTVSRKGCAAFPGKRMPKGSIFAFVLVGLGVVGLILIPQVVIPLGAVALVGTLRKKR